MLDKGHPSILIDRNDHQNGRRDADKRMGTKARGPSMKGSLKADHRANHERARNPSDDY
jgi:hypothetical protein